MVKAPLETKWRVLADGWIAGRRAEKGDVLDLTEAEAKYEPVEPYLDEAETPAATAGKRKAGEGAPS